MEIFGIRGFHPDSAWRLWSITSRKGYDQPIRPKLRVFGKNISTQLIDAHDAVVDARKQILILNPHKLSDRDKIDGALTLENLSPRVRAAEALQTYGDLLEAIVEDTQQQELTDAAKAFTTSLRGLDPSSKKLSDDQLTAIGSLIQDIGGLLVEYKKKKAMKELIPATHDQILTIAELFKQEFKTDGPLTTYVNATSACWWVLRMILWIGPRMNRGQRAISERPYSLTFATSC